jgi:DAK2 domain fusion protein YloV
VAASGVTPHDSQAEVDVLERLDAATIGDWAGGTANALTRYRQQIDDLNVFPVADADTGTNLAATLTAAAAEVAAAGQRDAAAAMRVFAQSAVLAARGNSGIIMAQMLCGLAEGIAADAGPDGLRDGLGRASDLAVQAVGDPVPGTMLSVISAAAESAVAAQTLSQMVTAAVQAADRALARTPEQLPVLARAGVVDAGGWGVVILLDGLAQAVTGRSVASGRPGRAIRSRAALAAAREHASSGYGFEVQYLLAAEAAAIAGLRAELNRIGDSVAVAGTGDGLWNVHVHADDVGAALEAGLEVGRARRISVISFADQLARAERPDHRTALVAIAPGPGLRELFEGEGVLVLDDVGQDLATGYDRFVLLPTGVEVEQIAGRARAEGVEVAVVPTRSALQTLAAVAVHDAGRRFEDDVIAMAEAAAATRFAEIRVADREALTTIGPCRAGDVLGLIDGEVVQIGRSVGAVTLAVADRLLGTGGELITVLVGEESAQDAGAALRRHVGQVAPLTEVVVYDVGPLGCPLLIGME